MQQLILRTMMKKVLNGLLLQHQNGRIFSFILNAYRTVKKFENGHDWSGLEFPVAIDKIGIFEKKNDVSVTILGVKGLEIYIYRKSKYKASNNVELLLITNDEKNALHSD